MNTVVLTCKKTWKRFSDMTIKLLNDELINKIAAGEVIERPASIVKELLENSIDAGSGKISVRINNAGMDRIEVEDDGEGISPAQLPLAFLRHATSKISKHDDLFNIHTLGFRGEALPSIASVSRIEIYSKREDDEGVYASLERGEVLDIKPFPCPQGSKIIVKDLFYNTPARKNFLKTPVTEGKHVYELICRYALARADISFSFDNDKKTFFKTPGNGKLMDTVIAIYGRDMAARLQEIEYQGETYSLKGLISNPETSRMNRKMQHFFVNRRPVRSPMLYKAVDTAYRGLLISREHPMVILNISMPAANVDVNVHPQKTEVRFQDEKSVFTLLNQVIRDSLDGSDHRISGDFISSKSRAYLTNQPNNTVQQRVHEQPLRGFASFAAVHETVEEASALIEAEISEADSREVDKDIRIVGQCLNSYILYEENDALCIADQHAAHERIMYARLQEIYKSGAEASQILAFPLPVELSSGEIELLENNAEFLQTLGFQFEVIGHTSIALRAVPAPISGQETETLLDIIQLLEEKKKINLKHEALAMMSCKKAVKAGTPLRLTEMEAIIKELYSVANYRHCPHGRPTIMILEHGELDRMFKR